MLNNIKYHSPTEIEKHSFELITELLGDKKFSSIQEESIVKRVIHTTADFDYADTIVVTKNAFESAVNAIQNGCTIITDTTMAMAGINKKVLESYGGMCKCFITDEDVMKIAKEKNTTRSCAAIDKAVLDKNNQIFVIGNAPTALIRLYELVKENKVSPALVVGVPVGFVNVEESKELFMTTSIPYIIAKGRKGGSNVAAAIINAILYHMNGKR